MRISKIHIKNFRSIHHLDLAVPQVCCLVGPNNAGKSNILLAVQRVLGRDWVSVNSFEEQDVYAHDSNADVTIQISFEPGIPFTKFKGGAAVPIRTLSFEYTRYKIGEEKGKRRLEQKCFDDQGKSPIVLAKAPRKGETHQYQPLVNVPSEVALDLDREGVTIVEVGGKRNLPEFVQISPSQHSEQLFKQILGSCQSVVEGLGALRNRLSDAHGRGKSGVRPAPRHVELAVNLAGTMATFLLETSEARKKS